jgi:RNA polymerase sigma-70 factor (ECF subfamily)
MTAPANLDALFESWWREHRGAVHRIVRAYAALPADQADMAQDIAVQLWRSLPGFTGQCRPATWVYRVALYAAMGWRRRQRARPVLDGAAAR